MPPILGLLLLVITTSFDVKANYICVCNRDIMPYQVFDAMQSEIGYLYPQTCAAVINSTDIESDWTPIPFNGMTGYIITNTSVNIVLDECNGDETATTEMPVTNPVPVETTYIPTTTTNTMSTNKTIPQGLKGDVSLCPSDVIQGSNSSGCYLAQHTNSCYELCTNRASWWDAHVNCKGKGGDLVTIHNDKENTYLHRILLHVYVHSIWIGLHDRVHEEQFQWITGEHLTYQNWKLHNRMSSNHTHEDCVIMYPTGFWNDIRCGGRHLGSEAENVAHGYVCEYRAQNFAPSIIG